LTILCVSQGPEPFSNNNNTVAGYNSGMNLIQDGTLCSSLRFRPEPVSGTLQNVGFLRVPELVPVPVRPEPISKFRIPRKWFWNPFYEFRVPTGTSSGTIFQFFKFKVSSRTGFWNTTNL
jgi:hypothetical protein